MPVGAILLALSLAACAPDPAPSPTPTGFASEEEAFAAAEATYRAYIDALNAVDLADPATFEPVAAITSGEAAATVSKELSQMHADKWTVSGTTRVASITPVSLEKDVSATLAVCADVSQVTLLDEDGTSQVAADRPPIQPLTIVVTFGTTTTVSSTSGRSGAPAC